MPWSLHSKKNPAEVYFLRESLPYLLRYVIIFQGSKEGRKAWAVQATLSCRFGIMAHDPHVSYNLLLSMTIMTSLTNVVINGRTGVKRKPERKAE